MFEYYLTCPWCWERISILLEEGREEEWIEDCEVCCNPILFRARIERGEVRFFEYSRSQ